VDLSSASLRMKQVEIDEDGSIIKEDWNLCILGSGRRVAETKRMCRRAEGQKRHNVSDLAEAARRAVMDGLAIVIFDAKALALACICLMLIFPVVLSFILRVIRGSRKSVGKHQLYEKGPPAIRSITHFQFVGFYQRCFSGVSEHCLMIIITCQRRI